MLFTTIGQHQLPCRAVVRRAAVLRLSRTELFGEIVKLLCLELPYKVPFAIGDFVCPYGSRRRVQNKRCQKDGDEDSWRQHG